MRPLSLAHVWVSRLRNLSEVEFSPAPRVNVIAGANGQGKTSLLEAIYLLCTSRSFRSSRLSELVEHDAEVASVRGKFEESGAHGALSREQSVGLKGGRRTVRLAGEAPSSLGFFATRSPVIVFEPTQMALTTGPAAERRTLLDRLSLFIRPEVAIHRSRYQRALKERHQLLADAGTQLDHNSALNAYEVLMAEHGAILTAHRRDAIKRLEPALQTAFGRIAAADLQLTVHYEQGGSSEQEEALAKLSEARSKDARRKSASYGPHRDDIAFELNGHPARVVASQGQHRALTLALKCAELDCIAKARGVQPILLLDDVSSELDPERTAALFDFLATTESQIFLTTTRPELITTPYARGDMRCDFRVSHGQVEVT